jgi:hypothetical protein
MFMPQLIRNFLYSWHCLTLLTTLLLLLLLLLLPGLLRNVHAAAHPQLPV